MADAQATFTINLDSSGLQAGAAAGSSALDRLRGKIQAQQKSLDALRGSMARLKASASVVRFEAIPKELEKAQAEALKLGADLAKAKKAIEMHEGGGGIADAKWWEKAMALQDKAKGLEDQLGGVTGKIKQLTGEQDKLSDDATVKSFLDQKARAGELEASLADLQSQYDGMGGDPEKLSEPIKGLGEALKESNTPLGNMVKQFSLLKAAGPAVRMVMIATAIVAITVAAIAATSALIHLAVAQASVARAAARQREAVALGNSDNIKGIEATMAALRSETSLSKTEAQGLAVELYRAGLRGKALEGAALTVERFGQLGEDAKDAVKSFYKELEKPTPGANGIAKSMVVTPDMLPRDAFELLARNLGKESALKFGQGFAASKDDIRAALQNIGTVRFADSAKEQMRDLGKLSERFQENLGSLFAGVKIGVLTGALQKLVDLLDEGSDSGKAIRAVLSGFMQPIIDMIEVSLPVVQGFFEGMLIGALLFVLGVLKVKNAIASMIPDGVLKNFDMVKIATYAGVAAMGAMLLAALALTAAVIVLGALIAGSLVMALLAMAPAAIAAVAPFLPLILAIAALAAIAYFAYKVFTDADFASAVGDMIDGAIQGVKDGAQRLWDSFKDLASGAVKAFKDAVKIGSPSKVFRAEARWIGVGAALGIEDGSEDVNKAVGDMVDPNAMTGAGGSGRGGGQIVMQAGAITINGVKDAEQMSTPAFERLMMRVFSQWASQGGVPVVAEATS